MNSRFVFVPSTPVLVPRAAAKPVYSGQLFWDSAFNHSRVAGPLHAGKSIFAKIKGPNVFAGGASNCDFRCLDLPILPDVPMTGHPATVRATARERVSHAKILGLVMLSGERVPTRSEQLNSKPP